MKRLLFIVMLVFLAAGIIALSFRNAPGSNIISYTVDPAKQDLRFYWKGDNGQTLGSIQRLKDYLAGKNQRLLFAMNGGMFRQDHSPVGLFIQQQATITPLDTAAGDGNFYLKPNGVLYVTKDNKAGICTTQDFNDKGDIAFATQSGPMLVIDGRIHPAFKKGSVNTNIRNAVGLLPGNKLVFALSTDAINFFDFAEYFRGIGCQQALYLDGFVSKAYIPEKGWLQTDGDFGVLIGVSAPGK